MKTVRVIGFILLGGDIAIAGLAFGAYIQVSIYRRIPEERRTFLARNDFNLYGRHWFRIAKAALVIFAVGATLLVAGYA